MIRVEYDEKTHTLAQRINGDSELILFELHVTIDKLLESYYRHDQEMLVLDEILDAVSEFAEKHTTQKTKGEKKDD